MAIEIKGKRGRFMVGAFVENRLKTLYSTLKDKAEIKIISAVVIFLILNALKIALFNYYLIQNHTVETLKYKFDMAVLLIVIIYPVIFKFKSRAVFLAVYILQIVYILVNISYFLYFHSYIDLMQWITLFKEAFVSTKHLATPKSPELIIAFIDLPVAAYMLFNYSRITALRLKLRFFVIGIIVLSFCLLISMEIRNYAQNCSIIQYLSNRYAGESPIVERYGTVANNLVNIYLNKGDKELISQLKYGKEQSNTTAAQQKPNFVVIQVESMDANVINKKYKDNYIAPFLHSLSDQNVYYPYVLSYHKGGGTSDSEFSIIDSVEPFDGFPALKLTNYNYPNSMVSKLAGASYETLAFHGNVGTFFNRDVAFPKLGFKEFYDMTKMNMKDVGWGAPDNDVFNFAFNKLKTVNQPFFSYVITMTSHGPFTNARNYYNNNAYDDIQDETVKNYFNSMSYVDQSIQNFVTNIRANFKNTYIFIWGDHTPNVNAELYKQASFTMDDKYFEFVPLIIITPDNKVYKEDKKVASFLDISPTVLFSSGVQFSVNSDGHNLLDFTQNPDNIPLKGSCYDRAVLFGKIAK